MEATAKLIEAIASLLWPILVGVILFVFRPGLVSLIESAKTRKFALKFGGQELTMDEANEQQRSLIADLQAQVVELRKLVVSPSAPAAHIEAFLAPTTLQPRSILWVDDNPKNNSYFVEQLEKKGVRVELAESTAEALQKVAHQTFNVVISDMGREEDGKVNTRAGLDLLQELRRLYPALPVVIFCSKRAVRLFGQKALELGAAGITSSPTQLFGFLHMDELGDS